MSQTIFSSEEGGLIALGSPGASRIPTAILQTLVNVLDFGMPLETAVLAPRFHAEGNLFAYEAGARTDDLDQPASSRDQAIAHPKVGKNSAAHIQKTARS
jgi:gamma-glutamyltranspeptidase/glutathione hydrolase